MTKITMKIENCPEIRSAMSAMPHNMFEEIRVKPNALGQMELTLTVKKMAAGPDAYEVFADKFRSLSQNAILDPVMNTGKKEYLLTSANAALVLVA
jgi:hydroxymethylpyrimidine/phosphomethylpyrimidine kinase